MGDLMRQYWLPAMLSSKLAPDGAPFRLMLFGEKLIAFRDVAIKEERSAAMGPSPRPAGRYRSRSPYSGTAHRSAAWDAATRSAQHNRLARALSAGGEPVPRLADRSHGTAGRHDLQRYRARSPAITRSFRGFEHSPPTALTGRLAAIGKQTNIAHATRAAICISHVLRFSPSSHSRRRSRL
jgi:hypothetical protein